MLCLISAKRITRGCIFDLSLEEKITPRMHSSTFIIWILLISPGFGLEVNHLEMGLLKAQAIHIDKIETLIRNNRFINECQ